MSKCDSCIHCKYIPMVVRGIMDADPSEEYCDLDMVEFSDEEGCEKYDRRENDEN